MLGLVIAALRGREKDAQILFYAGLADIIFPICGSKRLIEGSGVTFAVRFWFGHTLAASLNSKEASGGAIDNQILYDILSPSFIISH